mmetsp:Transcript_3378/g.8740  ORF Transcript_3378/g.8740 Transcript_3378/m.8740 type:complete len:201 (-) Transcript_3378:174-776(-)
MPARGAPGGVLPTSITRRARATVLTTALPAPRRGSSTTTRPSGGTSTNPRHSDTLAGETEENARVWDSEWYLARRERRPRQSRAARRLWDGAWYTMTVHGPRRVSSRKARTHSGVRQPAISRNRNAVSESESAREAGAFVENTWPLKRRTVDSPLGEASKSEAGFSSKKTAGWKTGAFPRRRSVAAASSTRPDARRSTPC